MMSQDKKKELTEKVLDAISSWWLIYDKERDIYIKVVYVSSVDDVTDENRDNKLS